MSRRVHRKVEKEGKLEVFYTGPVEIEDEVRLCDRSEDVDWTNLPNDIVIQLFSCLSYRDRASMASTCRIWRALGASPYLWNSLDVRAHKCDPAMAISLASRCVNLEKIKFRGAESAKAITFLVAKNLREIIGDHCWKLTDATLSVIGNRHRGLETLQLGPEFCERITGDAIKAIAFCCRKLRKLRLSGVKDVSAEAIEALGTNCPNLIDIGFLDCLNIDEAALENVRSLRYLSVAGAHDMKWNVVLEHWSKLPNLIGVDVSRTSIGSTIVYALMLSSPSLKVLCALKCHVLEWDKTVDAKRYEGKLLLVIPTDILNGMASLFVDNTTRGRDAFLDWRNSKIKNQNVDEIMTWLEWILSHALMRTAEYENNPQGLDKFWIEQGAKTLLSLMQSSQEDVQEMAVMGLSTLIVIDDEDASIDGRMAEAVMREGGIRLLLELAQSGHEALQSEVAKAISKLSINANVAKAVADGGGIEILIGLARSTNRLVAEAAAGGLWNLSAGEKHKGAIAKAGGVKALVDLIFKWFSGGDVVLERAAGALANLAADNKCSMKVALAGGIQALVMLAHNCNLADAQEQAARALANLAAHADNNTNRAAVGQEKGALEALVQLTCSHHEGVRKEAASALWNLSFDDRNRAEIAAVGGLQALVTLAQSCSNASDPVLREMAAGALWGLSVSEANSIVIGQEGGIGPLLSLAQSLNEKIHEPAAGALWNLSFNPGNAFRLLEEYGGIIVLGHLCATSKSMVARFMAALTLAYMFDGRMDDFIRTLPESILKSLKLTLRRNIALTRIKDFILTFSDPQALAVAAESSASGTLTRITERARIQKAGYLKCSGTDIVRLVAMLRHQSSVLKLCAAFALLQLTVPGGRHSVHHAYLMQGAGAARVLRVVAAGVSVRLETKIFARIVLRNLERHQIQLPLLKG